MFSNAEPPIQIILNATAPTSSPAGFSFSLESNASIANAEQKISLYNYVTGQYEVLDTRLATTSDDTVNVNVIADTSRFIQPVTMAIRTRVSYQVTEGHWVKYEQGSDHVPLVISLQGHGTGWCTAGESTAKLQLKAGDFYVYYSLDGDGQPTIP